jgi:hypothetical protein
MGQRTGNPRGRPKGAISRMSREAREAAASSGQLPHEFLLQVSRGEAIGDYQPDFKDRMAAAIAAAPFFAPKMAATEHSGSIAMRSHEDALADLA